MPTDTVSALDDRRGANAAATTLYVCLTCRKVPVLEAATDADALAGNATDATSPVDEMLPGRRLFDALGRARAANGVEDDVQIVGVGDWARDRARDWTRDWTRGEGRGEERGDFLAYHRRRRPSS